ncbi:unnamed protein product [Ilex paraguariensis]|uniref:Phorbol-ester/DAG-type domain-containing protein n=1 Tax=Ilex paraguariensis TaxID=185542 RepID=A0ABC8SJB0_9AQUA
MKMELQHFSHKDHPLILKELQEEESGRIICYGCEKTIFEDSMYSCGLCDYFLHKRCAELPQEINDPLHYQHLLTLYAYSPYPSSVCACNACRKVLNRFNYSCISCQFNLCMSCFLEERTITHTSHEHPLAVISRQALFWCNACGTESKDLSYMCHPCGFWIHKTCALSPSTITCSDHPHPLLLVKQHFKLTNFDQDCDLCGVYIDDDFWAYYCGPCRYFVHLKCFSFRGGEDENIVVEPPDSNVIHLPVTDGFEDFIKKFVEQLDLEERERETEVTYFGHEHPLTLSEVQGDNEIKEEKILCNGCVQPISSLFYSCRSHCNYSLHLSCINLPTELQHPSHLQHPLCLFNYKRIYDAFQCNLCRVYTNGLFYNCETCDFFLDIKCACLADEAYAHKAHKHPLFRSEGSEYNCNACSFNFSGIRFGCDKCKFYICTRCVVLPHIINHRWDKHPLTLNYSPYFDHPDEFHCEYCEDEINPKFWMYHCRDCDQSFHTRCVENLRANYKLGGTVQIIDHPHRLMFLKKKNPYSKCSKCSEDKIYLLECLECNYTICLVVAIDHLNLALGKSICYRVEFGNVLLVGELLFCLLTVVPVRRKQNSSKTV